MTQVMDQWSTTKPLLSTLPQWIADEQERRRIASYALYEAIYWCVPDTFKIVRRGSESHPIYIPSGRIIVETINRYVAPRPQFIVDPAFGTPNDQALALQVMTDFARRERLYSRFATNKRYGIMRGDWFWHIYADPLRPVGARVSLLPVDPASVFPIYNPTNVDEIIGYHIAEQFKDNEGKVFIRRLTYRKVTGTGGPSPITVEDAIFELDKWGGPGMAQDDSPVQVIMPPTQLPAPIDQLPLYHLQNMTEPGSIWGSSEMRGLERIIAAQSQTVSDQELALALEGLGVYWTNAGSPVDEDGNDIPWDIGPGRVLEIPTEGEFGRVQGVNSVAPSLDHLNYLQQVLDEALGLSAAAKGRPDVTVAESGVALYLELAPLLARAEEKDQIVIDVLNNMLFDLAKWFVAYEGTILSSLVDASRWTVQFSPKVPTNTQQEFDNLITLATSVPQIVPLSYVRDRLRLIGYNDLPTEDEIQTLMAAEMDAVGARADAEINALAVEAEGADLTGLE